MNRESTGFRMSPAGTAESSPECSGAPLRACDFINFSREVIEFRTKLSSRVPRLAVGSERSVVDLLFPSVHLI